VFIGLTGFLVYKKRFAPIEVKGAIVTRQEIEATVTGTSTGIIKSDVEVNVTAQRSGKITNLFYDEGDTVKKGDLIAQLDTSEVLANLRKAEAELRQAEANLSNIEAEHKRKESLFNEQLLSKQQFDDVTTRLLLAKASLENAKAVYDVVRLQYEYSFIKAPVNGVIAERPVKVGDTTAPGQKIVSIVDPSRLYISAPVDEADVDRVSIGQEARITMDAYPNRTFTGRVLRISPIVTGARLKTRTFEVRVSVPEDNIIIKPGMSADIEIITGRVTDAVVIPSQAVIDKGLRHFVYVAESGRAKLREVETGLFNWNLTEIKAGLTEGEIVIFTPDDPGFREGVRVRVVD
jgi:HlyD family secretion protein